MDKNKNYGLGFMTEDERNNLRKSGAIKTISLYGHETDVVVAEYPKLVVRKSNGEEETVDMGGDLFQLKMEMEDARKNGKSARIEFFPRHYSQFISNKESKEKALLLEKEALNSLINTV